MNLSALTNQKKKYTPINVSKLRKPIEYKPTSLNVSAFDVIKEVPWATKELGKEIGQSIMRNITSVIGSEALEPIVKPITKKVAKIEKESPTFRFFTEELSNRLYGDLSSKEITELTFETRAEQIAPIGKRVIRVEEKLKEKGKEYEELSKTPGLSATEKTITTTLGKTLQKGANPLAFGIILGYTGFDLTPVGGSKKTALKAFKQINNTDDAIRVLTKMGVDDDLVKFFADDLVKVKDTKTAEKLFNNIINLQKTTKSQAVKGEIDLIQEAKKYKSAEEFVKAQGEPVYRGGRDMNDYFSTHKHIATEYSKARGGNISQRFIDKNAKTIDYDNVPGIKYKGVNDYDIERYAQGQDILEFMNSKLEADYSKATKWAKENGYDAITFPTEGEFRVINKSIIKTKSQLTDIWNKANKATSEEKGAFKGIPVVDETGKEITKIGENLPTVIQGETFTLGTGRIIQPTTKELKTGLKAEIKATKQEIKNAKIAQQKADRLLARQQKIRTEAIENINRQHGNTERIIKQLKKKYLSDEDIANIILEDGTKLVDTVKVKRNPDGSLATVITKKQINELKRTYTGKTPERWVRKYSVARVGEKVSDVGQIYELPYIYFEKKGLSQIYDTVIHEGERAGEVMKNSFLKRFKDDNLFKEGGWFTADRFKLSKKEGNKIGKYYLSRQKKGFNVSYESLTTKEKKFVDIFDGIIDDTEPKFYEVAKKNGKSPGKVENYAPIMTKDDIKLIDNEIGTMDFIMRKHPAFFSLKERAKKVPKDLYETDYRKVAARWLDGISRFNTTGDIAPDIKYLLDSDQFKKIVNPKDYETIYEWFRDTITPQIPRTAAGKSVNFVARFLRKTAAISSLGLNYASVAKQILTQIPLTIIGKAPPEFHSKFAKAFGISVKDLPSITARKGNVAIMDLQGKIGRIFTGPLTKFDKQNAQVSLNRLLDKEWKKFLKQGTEITPAIQDLIKKKAQDALDLWYGGMVSIGQRPEAFRKELGKFINMFIYPLTSQLNGFYRHIYQAKGWKNAQAVAEVAATATTIAYLEQVITNLSPKWSDEVEMTKDTMVSLAGNIPILGQIAWSITMDDELQISAGVSGIETLRRKLVETSKGIAEPGEIGFAIGETFGLPKQFRRTFYEGMNIIEKGGITDKEGKMLVPVKETDELIRSILRGKYGSMAAKDWVRNIGEKKENRRWFIPEVEFLQNGDYERKAELYNQFTSNKQKELKSYLSENQQSKLDKALKKAPTRTLTPTESKKSLDEIFGEPTTGRKSLEAIFGQ